MLIDDILFEIKPREPTQESFVASLRRSTVVKIQNVAEYVFEKPALEWNLKSDFPNIAPPFPHLWMEWTHDTRWSLEKSEPNFPDRFRIGLYLASIDLQEEPQFGPLKSNLPGCRWFSIACFFLDIGDIKEGISMMPCLAWGVSADGLFIPVDGGLRVGPNPLSGNESLRQEQIEAMDGLQFFLVVPFMALSFMHCRNIPFLKGAAHPPALQAARARRGKPPLLRWHTLDINPARKIVSDSNGGNASLTPKSLHICRGHFKHFEERGLFGKHRGMFWWPMHSRGSRSAGRVIKDYRILPPGGAIGG